MSSEPLAPLADRVLGDPQLMRDRRVAQPIAGAQHDAGAALVKTHHCYPKDTKSKGQVADVLRAANG
jgi:hypothetical protein